MARELTNKSAGKTSSKAGVGATTHISGIEPETLHCHEELVRTAQIVAILLMDGRATLHPENVTTGEKGIECQVVVDPPRYSVKYAKEINQLVCGVRLRAKLFIGGQKPVAEAYAEYSLRYMLPSSIRCNEPGLRLFASHNAVFNAWPFFREFAHSMTSRMGVPPVVLPLHRPRLASSR